MKKFFILSCFLLGLIVSANSYIVYTQPYSITVHESDDFPTVEQIILHGRLTTGKAKYSVGNEDEPLRVFKAQNNLEINFFSTLGNIDIAVYDGSSNLIHHSNVNIKSEGQINIDISAWNPGTYRIQFRDVEDGFMYGDFEVK